MPIGPKEPSSSASDRTGGASARTRSTSLVVGGAIVAAALAALVAYAGAGGSRDIDATATTVTKSPPTDHPAVTEPTRPSLLPTQVPPK